MAIVYNSFRDKPVYEQIAQRKVEWIKELKSRKNPLEFKTEKEMLLPAIYLFLEMNKRNHVLIEWTYYLENDEDKFTKDVVFSYGCPNKRRRIIDFVMFPCYNTSESNSFELKLKNFNEALDQARQNLELTPRSYLIMPTFELLKRFPDKKLENYGIGIVGIERIITGESIRYKKTIFTRAKAIGKTNFDPGYWTFPNIEYLSGMNLNIGDKKIRRHKLPRVPKCLLRDVSFKHIKNSIMDKYWDHAIKHKEIVYNGNY